jgi:hypothetical protein
MDGMASMRAKLLSIPAKLALILAAETNVVVARNLLEAELREARPACGVEVPLEQNWSRRPQSGAATAFRGVSCGISATVIGADQISSAPTRTEPSGLSNPAFSF